MDDPLRRRSEDAAAGSDPGRGSRLARCAPPLALALAAFALRALPWRLVFDAGRLVFHDNDAYYHARRIFYTVVRFPEVLDLDPYLNYPDGGEPIWSPLFDFAAALLARLTVGSDLPAMERLLVWIPPALGAATAALAWWIARTFFGRGAAWLAGGLVAVLPASFQYSRIGFVDHHAAVALVGAALLAAGLGWCRAGAAGRGPGAGLALGSGVLVAVALLLWPGMILDVALFGAGCLALLATRPRADVAGRVAFAGALAFGAAALLVAPFAWGREWQAWGSFTPVVLSSFQPAALLAAAAGFAALAVALRAVDPSATPARRIALVLTCAGVLLGAVLIVVPELRSAWGDVWRWFAKEERFQVTVSESRPLLFYRPGRLGFGLAISQLSLLFFLAPVLFAAAAWRLRRATARPEAALLLGWTLAFFAAGLVQLRFTNSLAVPFALLVGWSGPPLVREAVRRAGGGPRTARTVGCAALLVLLAPALASYVPYLRGQQRWLAGLPPERTAREERKLLLLEVADWLRESTEPTSGWLDAGVRPEYAVLSHWADGHVLKYVARRPTVVDNFGDDLGEENFALSEEYYLAAEPRGSEILDRLGARYVIFEQRGLASRREAAAGALLPHLTFADGAAAERALALEGGRPRAAERPVDAVERHRLVFETAPRRGRGGPPAFKVYEHVRGALLSGTAPAGARVEARLALETNRGRRFEFLAAGRADAAGRFALRFPYATRGSHSAVRSAPEVEVRSGDGVARVPVGEGDVREGRVVPVPAFRPEAGYSGAPFPGDASR
jgi:dolichyl-diphosphooligosaccharide--protein glycosyltransferase